MGKEGAPTKKIKNKNEIRKTERINIERWHQDCGGGMRKEMRAVKLSQREV